MNTKRFAEQLKKIRKERNLSQKELAKLAELGDVQISTYENGKVTPKRQSLIKIAEALQVPVTVFDDTLAYPEDASVSRDELINGLLEFVDLRPSYIHSRMILEMLKFLSNSYKIEKP